jgi:hypothetical protein
MSARTSTELSTTELPEELQFRVVRNTSLRGWIYHSVSMALAVLAAAFTVVLLGRVLGWRDWGDSTDSANFWSFMACMYIAGLVGQWLDGHVTQLRITSEELVATRNPGINFFARTTLLAISDVESLRLSNGGLLLERNGIWGRPIWILPGLSKEQGAGVMKAVLAKFPEIWGEFYPVGSHLGLRPLTSASAKDQELAAQP